MFYLIHAYEDTYGGLHGVEDWDIVDCMDEVEAEDIGMDMALDVINSYSEIYEDIVDEANEDWERECDSIDMSEKEEWIDDRVNEIAHELACYDIWPLIDGIDYQEILDSYCGEPDYEEIKEKYEVKYND